MGRTPRVHPVLQSARHGGWLTTVARQRTRWCVMGRTFAAVTHGQSRQRARSETPVEREQEG